MGERFFRVVGTYQDGCGLGWSIVRRIVALDQATWRVLRSEPLHGLCMEV